MNLEQVTTSLFSVHPSSSVSAINCATPKTTNKYSSKRSLCNIL